MKTNHVEAEIIVRAGKEREGVRVIKQFITEANAKRSTEADMIGRIKGLTENCASGSNLTILVAYALFSYISTRKWDPWNRWDFEIQTNNPIPTRISNLVLINKKKIIYQQVDSILQSAEWK